MPQGTKKVKDKPLYEWCNEVQRGLLSIKAGPGGLSLKKSTKGVSVSDHSCSRLAEHQKWFTEKPWHRLFFRYGDFPPTPLRFGAEVWRDTAEVWRDAAEEKDDVNKRCLDATVVHAFLIK
jgi:hypothetical protein